MKKLVGLLCGVFIILSFGCSADPEITKAENLIGMFNCSISSLPEDADITKRYNFNAMQDDKNKVNTWLAHYKDGNNEFNKPITVIIQSQLEVFKSSCESLGGHLIK